MPSASRFSLLVLVVFLLSCGDSSGPAGPDPTGPTGPTGPTQPAAAVRIEVRPSTLLLTEAGETRALEVVAWDAAGEPTEVQVTWASSDPAAVGVDTAGVATAATGLGSAVITASAGGVTSAPVLAVVAEPVAGAVLVDDAQVVEGPEPLSPADDYGPGWQYRFTLTGIDVPAPGTPLLATGGAAIAGRVVSASASGSDVVVTLELVPVPELFERLSMDVALSLGDVPFEIDAGLAQHYHIRRLPTGAVRFDPRAPGAVWRPSDLPIAADGTDVEFNLGPFRCKASGSIPELDLPQPKLEVKSELTIHIVYGDVFEKLSLQGDVDVELGYKPVFKAVFAGKMSCERVVGRLVIPISGFATWFFAGVVPLGIGMDLDAKATLAEAGFDVKAKGGVTAELGIQCPGGGGCGPLTRFETKPFDPSFELIAPDPQDQFHLEMGAYAYALARLAFGPPLVQALQFEAFEGKAGIKQSVDVKTAHAQAKDPGYASGFTLDSKISLGPGKHLQQALRKAGDLLGVSLNFTLQLLPDLEPLARSPMGTFTIEPASVEPGDTTQLGDLATFRVELSPITYLGLQAVEKVEFFWKKDGENGDFTLENGRPNCSVLAATPGQSTFTCQTDFLEDHMGEQTFHAFVHAKLFGSTVRTPFEVAKDGSAKVVVGDQCTPPGWASDYEFPGVRAEPWDYANGAQGVTQTVISEAHTDLSGKVTITAPGGSSSTYMGGGIRFRFFDIIKIVPADPSRIGEPLGIRYRLTASASTSANHSTNSSAFATAKIGFPQFHDWRVGLNRSTNYPATEFEFDEEITTVAFVQGWSDLSVSLDMDVAGRRGATASSAANLSYQFLSLVDADGQPVAIGQICSLAGKSYLP